jgi:hypothetical protein
MIWTHAEADRRGISVDRQKLEAWTDWALLNVISGLDAAPDGEADTLSQLLLSRDLQSDWFNKPPNWHSRPADPYENITKHLIKAQADEGSWVAGGQSRNPVELPTGWAIVALAERDKFMQSRFPVPESNASFHSMKLDNDKASLEAREKAIAWLRPRETKEAMDLTEGLVTRLLVERRFGSEQEVQKWLGTLLSRQNDDGGWSVNVSRNQPSDAFATGQVLYGLCLDGIENENERQAVMRGSKYLIDSQGQDGSWRVPSTAFADANADIERARTTDEVYSYWGTGWAALGLLHAISLFDEATSHSRK